MIVIDSSAVIAVLLLEPDHAMFQDVFSRNELLVISAMNAHEAAVVLRVRLGPEGPDQLWQFLDRMEIKVVAFDEMQARLAVDAYHRFGKGINARARLNLADCAAYALAKMLNAPLLFKGDDFRHTDLAFAIPPA